MDIYLCVCTHTHKHAQVQAHTAYNQARTHTNQCTHSNYAAVIHTRKFPCDHKVRSYTILYNSLNVHCSWKLAHNLHVASVAAHVPRHPSILCAQSPVVFSTSGVFGLRAETQRKCTVQRKQVSIYIMFVRSYIYMHVAL